jgi:RES domain-containing protein
MIDGWRIVKAKHARLAFSGEASSVSGGRWNSPGTKIIYTASSVSLAILEILVHLGRSDILGAYHLFHIAFDDSLVRQLDRSSLPSTWRNHPPPIETQAIGDQWSRANASVALAVPSVIVPHETNYLLNPGHHDFSAVRIDDPTPFPIDDRLFRAA